MNAIDIVIEYLNSINAVYKTSYSLTCGSFVWAEYNKNKKPHVKPHVIAIWICDQQSSSKFQYFLDRDINRRFRRVLDISDPDWTTIFRTDLGYDT